MASITTNAVSRHVLQVAKPHSWQLYLLGKWQKRLQSASGYPNNPYKNTQTAPTTTHGRSNQQASAEMTPLTLSSVSCKFKVNLLEPRQLEPMATETTNFSKGGIVFANWPTSGCCSECCAGCCQECCCSAVDGGAGHVCHWTVSGCCPGCCAGVLSRVLRIMFAIGWCQGAVRGAPDHVCH